MQSPARWLAHSPMTNPAPFASLLNHLPPDIASLNQIVQGLVVHCAWIGNYGAEPGAFGPISRTTLSISQRLAALLNCNVQGLAEARPPTQREVGTCRDFALLLCAFLRTSDTPARLRCGFASYFGNDWEDHWICEYWDRKHGKWCLSDPQLDAVIRSACNVTFDTSNMPRSVFLTAGQAWLQCRTGQANPDRFGQGDTKGLWFMKVNVIRDSAAVNDQEVSAWDSWREAPPNQRIVPSTELPELDRLAHNPEEPPDELIPPWLNGVVHP